MTEIFIDHTTANAAWRHWNELQTDTLNTAAFHYGLSERYYQFLILPPYGSNTADKKIRIVDNGYYVPEATAHRIKLLASPHYRAIIKAHEACQEVT